MGWRALSRATALGLRAGLATALASAASTAAAVAVAYDMAANAADTSNNRNPMRGFSMVNPSFNLGRRAVPGEWYRCRAGHRADCRFVADQQPHLALEAQVALHGGTRADDNQRNIVAERYSKTGRLFDQYSTVHMGCAHDTDVAVDRADAAAHMRRGQRDSSVDVA